MNIKILLIICLNLIIIGCAGSEESAPVESSNSGSFASSNPLTAEDVRLIIQQAVSEAVNRGEAVSIAVVDRGGNVLGAFKMDGTTETVVIGSQNTDVIAELPEDERGLELTGLNLPGIIETMVIPPELAAVSKAATAAILSTSGNAFSTLTTSHIIQEHRPPGISFLPSGPLFGVQFSSLACSDIISNSPLPLGLAADPGGLPLYKDGEPVGGIGIEGVLENFTVGEIEVEEARYSLAQDPFGDSQPLEELIAAAGIRGFESPGFLNADTILLDGFRLPFINNRIEPPDRELIPFGSLPGEVIEVRIEGAAPVTDTVLFDGTLRDTPNPDYGFASATIRGIEGRVAVDSEGNNRFPFQSSDTPGGLTAGEVETILGQAMEQAVNTRAAIRQPAGSFAQVNITVVDSNGVVLGYFGTPDAPFFGFDVSAQKARTAAFFSNEIAGSELSNAALERAFLSKYLVNAETDGLGLDGSVAFSDRGAGFLNRPFLPDGIDGTEAGPFSKDISIWSPFNVGLQLDLVITNLLSILAGEQAPLLGTCTGLTGLGNGIQIFAGSVPLFKNGVLVGGVGVSGDGIDQDDLVAAMGSVGFEAPPEIRSDTVFVRGVRLPFVRFPRNPEISDQ